MVQQTLEEQQVESVAFHRTLQIERLNALLNAVWDAASGQQPRCGRHGSAVIRAQVRVLGMIETGMRQRVKCRQPQTVVVPPSDMRYCVNCGCPYHT